MSTAMKVFSGLLLLVIGGAAGAFVAKGGTTSLAETTDPPVPTRASESSSANSPENVAAFLRRVGPTFQEASSLCFRAEQCGSIEREPQRGALASAEEMPACLKERLPVCGALAEKLTGLVPPTSIVHLWGGALMFRVSQSFQHALLTSQLIIDAGGPPAMTFSSKPYVDVEDWVKRERMPIAAKYAALREQGEKWQQDYLALDEWVRVRNLCSTPNVRCTLDRVMTGR